MREVCKVMSVTSLQAVQAAPSSRLSVVACISNSRAPILMRPKKQVLPRGPLEVVVNGRPMTAWVVKIAVNVLTQRDNKGANLMGEVMRGWFGPEAGKPGSKAHVQFRKQGEVWVLEPVTEAEAAAAAA